MFLATGPPALNRPDPRCWAFTKFPLFPTSTLPTSSICICACICIFSNVHKIGFIFSVPLICTWTLLATLPILHLCNSLIVSWVYFFRGATPWHVEVQSMQLYSPFFSANCNFVPSFQWISLVQQKRNNFVQVVLCWILAIHCKRRWLRFLERDYNYLGEGWGQPSSDRSSVFLHKCSKSIK